MNLNKAPFNNKNVRKALNLAIDRDYIANTIMQGTYSPAYNFAGPGVVDNEGMFFDNAVKENGGDAVGIEGLETGEWVLVDCGSAIVHIMQPALRAYYNLEELWGGHPVRMKLLEDENKEDSE